MADKGLLKITDSNYETVTEDGWVLVDFWAPWCGPCKAQTPIVEAIAEKYAGEVTVGECNVDESPAAANHFDIQSIPTLLLLNAGELKELFVGTTPEDVISEIIDFEMEN